MLASLKLILYFFKRTARTVLPLVLLIIIAETVFFLGIRVAGAAGRPLSGGLMYILFNYVPQLFYLVPLVVPLLICLRSLTGCDACLMRSLPVLPTTVPSAMMISSIAWTFLAEICRTMMCAFSLSLNASLANLERADAFILIFSAYGIYGYVFVLMRNVLAVTVAQLYCVMVVLLAEMSPRRKKLLAFVYGISGSVLIFFAFAYLAVYDVSEESSVNAAFITYFPQLICLACFIILFTIVSSFILRYRHETE